MTGHVGKKAKNPQKLQLVPPGSPRTRPRWTQILLHWLRRPLAYTQCPHMCMHSLVTGHNTSNATSQQCRGFHSSQLGAIWAKKADNPPKKYDLCPPQFSKRPALMDPIPFALVVASPGVHIMPSPVHAFPVGRAEHVKCHQSAGQGFSFYQLGSLWAKKANNPPKGPTCPPPPPLLQVPGPYGPHSFCIGCSVP